MLECTPLWQITYLGDVKDYALRKMGAKATVRKLRKTKATLKQSFQREMIKPGWNVGRKHTQVLIQLSFDSETKESFILYKGFNSSTPQDSLIVYYVLRAVSSVGRAN